MWAAFIQWCGMNVQILVEPVFSVPCSPLWEQSITGALGEFSWGCVVKFKTLVGRHFLGFFVWKFDNCNCGFCAFRKCVENVSPFFLSLSRCGKVLYQATVSILIMEVLRGWADGRILMTYLSSVDVPFGISLMKLFGCRVGRSALFQNSTHNPQVELQL